MSPVTASYLFLISKLIVYRGLLRRLDLHLLRGRAVRGVTVGQVANSRVSKLGLFMSVHQKQEDRNLTCCDVSNVSISTVLHNMWEKKRKKCQTRDSPINNKGSDEYQNSQDGQNSTNHVADMKSFPCSGCTNVKTGGKEVALFEKQHRFLNFFGFGRMALFQFHPMPLVIVFCKLG